MAPPSSSSSSSSSSSKSPPLPPPHPSPLFTPIEECEEEVEEEEDGQQHQQEIARNPISATTPQRHNQTPLHHRSSRNKASSAVPAKKPYAPDTEEGGGTLVSCSNCRPHARDKISVVPLDNLNRRRSSTVPSPNGILKSIVSTLTGKSPRFDNASPSSSAAAVTGEDRWKAAVAELSHKLVQVTRRRDEAVTEASRLKSSVSELEKKLDRLESYCRNLKTDLDQCSSTGALPSRKISVSIPTWFTAGNSNDKVIERFLVAVADARSSVRILSRSLTVQLRGLGGGGKVYERLLLLLKPYEVKAMSITRNPRGLSCYLEALLNRAFFEDFEATGFQKSGATLMLNPMDRCVVNLEQFRLLDGLTWEEVLSKGTRHFSEEFSRFCDRKMSEIVGMLGWNRAWPEPLLQAFFRASKGAWLVHLLANSVHPALPIFRVETGSPFDPVYMEDVSADRARRLVPSTVRGMVTPGFYVYGSVVKCKVLCRYHTSNVTNTSNNVNDGSVANDKIKTALSP